MAVRDRVWRGVRVLCVLAVLALVLGQALGQPLLLSYVRTDSMEPTLDPGDGFVAVPEAVADPPSEGDIVVFEAAELHGGGLVTHRVVESTPEGYITKGDANAFTDQDGPEPPVPPERVRAVGLQVGGSLVVVPELGTAVTAVQSALTTAQQRAAVVFDTRALLGVRGLGYLLLGVGVLLYLVAVLTESGSERDRERNMTPGRDDAFDPRPVILALALVVVVPATVAMVGGSGGYEVRIDPAQNPAGANDTVTTTYRVPNGGIVPMTAVLRGESGVAVADGDRTVVVPGNGDRNVTLTASVPPDSGVVSGRVTEHRYPAVLPPSVIRWLHGVHPTLGVLVVDGLLAGAFGGIALRLVGRRPLRRRPGPRTRALSAVGRLRRWLTSE